MRLLRSKKFRINLVGYGFVLLSALGIFFFNLGPMLSSFYLSFCNYDIITPPKFIGLTNFYNILFNDKIFWKAFVNTVYYVGVSVPLRLLFAFLIAILLNQKIRGMGFYRTIFYLPTVTSGVAMALIWTWVLNPSFGIINMVLNFFGIQGPAWLGDPKWAMPGIILVALWQVGTQVVIFLSGLQNVPTQFYEAAEIDGAGSFRKHLFITIPLISPIFFFNLVIGIIQSFQVFDKVYIMTAGGPANATIVYVMYLYEKAFTWLQMGYGSALAWILFFIIMMLTLLQFKFSKWVYYEGGR
ncbi:MAG: sugar ABC transporter permease [bacterium]|nr:sugar ABC transporter permease [bacterium]